MKSNKTAASNGFTLLELIVTTAMLAALTASCMVVVRTSYTAWQRHEQDHERRQSGLEVLNHIVRTARQARAVTNISLSSDNSGSLTLLDSNGNLLIWEHDGATKQVNFGIGTADNLLASGVEELTFVGFKVDGMTPTTESGLIHSVECTTKVNVNRPDGPETIATTSTAWLRAW